jgi:phosphonate transport system substrate-binding protein
MIICKRHAAVASLLTACALTLASCAGRTPATTAPTIQANGQAAQPIATPDGAGTESENTSAATGDASDNDNALGTDTNPLVFAFVPSRGLGDAEANAAQFVSRLTSTTGLVIQAYVAQTNAEVVEALCSGQAHLAVLNTAYIAARERMRGRRIGRYARGLPFTTGQIIARVDSGITDIADLAPFCRDSRFSASGWVIPALLMRANGLNPDTDLGEILDTGSHLEVVRELYQAECDAGATYVDAREELLTDFPTVMDVSTVVATTEAIPNEIIAFHPNIPDEIRQQLVDTLLAITEDESGNQILRALYNWESLIEIDDTLFEVFDSLLSAPGVEPDDFLGD